MPSIQFEFNLSKSNLNAMQPPFLSLVPSPTLPTGLLSIPPTPATSAAQKSYCLTIATNLSGWKPFEKSRFYRLI